jgi:phage tail-like protein
MSDASYGRNMAFEAATGALGVLGVRLDPHQACNFLVEIEGLLVGGFSECTGLQAETEYLEYREGGVNDYVHRFAGPTKYPPLILKHGLTMIGGLWDWHQRVTEGNFKRRNGSIYLLNQMHLPIMVWNFKEAFPLKYTGPDLRADSASVAFESVELAHRGLSKPKDLIRALGAIAAYAEAGAEVAEMVELGTFAPNVAAAKAAAEKLWGRARRFAGWYGI